MISTYTPLTRVYTMTILILTMCAVSAYIISRPIVRALGI